MSTCQPSAHAIKDTAALLKQELDATATHIIRAPGRVNLIGEHTDYNDGFVLPCAIDFATEVAIAPRTDNRIRVVAADYDNQRDEFAADARPQHSDKGWANYIRGVVDVFIQRFGPLPHGLDMVVSGNVPQGAGLSSSAALEVAVGKALQTAFGLDTSLRDIALLGQQAENEFVGCRCGIMDQFISAGAVAGHADHQRLVELGVPGEQHLGDHEVLRDLGAGGAVDQRGVVRRVGPGLGIGLLETCLELIQRDDRGDRLIIEDLRAALPAHVVLATPCHISPTPTVKPHFGPRGDPTMSSS